MKPTTLTIGLTGGIGSGKSTVANLFQQLGITIIDTDQIARDVVAPGTDAQKRIVKHFGKHILDDKSQLNRAKLRSQIFNNLKEKRWLEQLLHPLIRIHMQHRIADSDSPYCIAVIPLLFETQSNPAVHRVLVVDSDPELQIKRTMARDHCSRAEVKKIIANQVSQQQRLANADDVVINDGSLAKLAQQIEKLHQFYLTLSQNRNEKV